MYFIDNNSEANITQNQDKIFDEIQPTTHPLLINTPKINHSINKSKNLV